MKKLTSAIIDLYVSLEKAGNFKYIRRIAHPNPKPGRRWIYFYTQQQIKDYKEKGVIPGEEKKGGLLDGIMSFFGLKDLSSAKKRVNETYNANKDKLQGIDKPTFSSYLNEYLLNKSKWDQKLSGEKKEKPTYTKDKKTGEVKKKDKTSVMSTGGGFKLSIMKQIAGVVGGANTEKQIDTKKDEFTKDGKLKDEKTGRDFEVYNETTANIIVKKYAQQGIELEAIRDRTGNYSFQKKDNFDTMPESEGGETNKDSVVKELKAFADIAKKYPDDINKSFEEAGKVKGVSPDMSDKFQEAFKNPKNDTPKEAWKNFVEYVNKGGEDKKGIMSGVKEFKQPSLKGLGHPQGIEQTLKTNEFKNGKVVFEALEEKINSVVKDWLKKYDGYPEKAKERYKNIAEEYSKANELYEKYKGKYSPDKSPVMSDEDGRAKGKKLAEKLFSENKNPTIGDLLDNELKDIIDSIDAKSETERERIRGSIINEYTKTTNELQGRKRYEESQKGKDKNIDAKKEKMSVADIKKEALKNEGLSFSAREFKESFNGHGMSTINELKKDGYIKESKNPNGSTLYTIIKPSGDKTSIMSKENEMLKNKFQDKTNKKLATDFNFFSNKGENIRATDKERMEQIKQELKRRNVKYDKDKSGYINLKTVQENSPMKKATSLLIQELQKAKKAPIGTVSGDYKKVAEGKWEKVSDGDKKKGQTEQPENKKDKKPEEGKDDPSVRREKIKNTLKKVTSMLADAFSMRDTVGTGGQTVEQAGEDVKEAGKEQEAKNKKEAEKKKKDQEAKKKTAMEEKSKKKKEKQDSQYSKEKDKSLKRDAKK